MTTEAHTTALALPDEQHFKHDLQAINRFQQVARANMVAGHDYGVIPGTSKPTLLKPGAEKIAKLLGLADKYELLDQKEDWDKPFFRYLIKCSLVSIAHDVIITEGLGECNSKETRYRWRDARRKCPACGAEAIIKGKAEYGGGWVCFGKKGGCGAKWEDGAAEIEGQAVGKVENEDIYSQVNTLLKMAKKRALVDASLSAGRLSEVFTQDIEDIGYAPDISPCFSGPSQSVISDAPAPTDSSPSPSQHTEQDISMTAFWTGLKPYGMRNDEVHARLDVSSMKDWVAQGKTLKEALGILKDLAEGA